MTTQEKPSLREATEDFQRKRDKILATLWDMDVRDWAEAVRLLASALNAVTIPRDLIATTTFRHVRASPSIDEKS